MDKVLVVNCDKCTDCQICQLVCSYNRDGEYNPKRSYIEVLENEEMNVFLPVLSLGCIECGRCVESCPTQALQFVSKEEAVLIRKANKIGTFPVPLMRRKE